MQTSFEHELSVVLFILQPLQESVLFTENTGVQIMESQSFPKKSHLRLCTQRARFSVEFPGPEVEFLNKHAQQQDPCISNIVLRQSQNIFDMFCALFLPL